MNKYLSSSDNKEYVIYSITLKYFFKSELLIYDVFFNKNC